MAYERRRRPGEDQDPNDDRPGQPRIFVAVPLSDEVRSSVGDLVSGVRAQVENDRAHRSDRPVRWVRLESLHLTLRFLGATDPLRIADVTESVQAAAREAARFQVTLGGAGAFPSAGRPRTIWLAVVDGAGELAELAARLDAHLAARGWLSENRPFRAHLTLARADGVRAGPRTVAALTAAAKDRRWSFRAEQVVLFESHLGGGPARYESLAVGHLGESSDARNEPRPGPAGQPIEA